jgi:hypothetical protein
VKNSERRRLARIKDSQRFAKATDFFDRKFDMLSIPVDGYLRECVVDVVKGVSNRTLRYALINPKELDSMFRGVDYALSELVAQELMERRLNLEKESDDD